MKYYIGDSFTPSQSYLVAKSKQAKTKYFNDAVYLDTETSHNHNKEDRKGWLTSWAFNYQDSIVLGRTPSDLINQLDKIRQVNYANVNNILVVFVHNLSYDLTYIFKFLLEKYGNDFECLAINNHKYITFTIAGIQFRCSYKLSNKSLDKWSKDLGTSHRKKIGQYDYDRIIYQDTSLKFSDWNYQVYDVLTLRDCVLKQNEIYGHTIATMPLTSTGYIRQHIRAEYKKDKKNYDNFKRTALNLTTNKLCCREFSGGMTHANRFLTNKTIISLKHCKKINNRHFKSYITDYKTQYKIVKGIIKHRDFRSHYPSQLRAKRAFPVGAFGLVYTMRDKIRLEQLFESIKSKCSLIEITIKDMSIREGVTIPFAQYSKLYEGRRGNCRWCTDNGRVLTMKGESTIVLTEYDALILYEQYKFRYIIRNVYQARKDFIPKFLADSIDIYFKGKTEYKDRLEELKEQGFNEYSSEFIDASMDLMKSKNGLNGIYGCSATTIIRENYKPSIDNEWYKSKDKTDQEQLDHYYKSRNNFNRYQIGIYTTSLARYELYEYMKVIGYSNIIYVDTDSIFYISNDKIERKIENLNENRYTEAITNKAYIEVNNKIVTYDSFDDEKEDITMFRTLHSKCYAYYEDRQLHVTIAGVTKLSRDYLKDHITRRDELGNINGLRYGKVFEKCGGNTCVYVNKPITKEVINGHLIEYADSAIIEPTTKTLYELNDLIDNNIIIESEIVE